MKVGILNAIPSAGGTVDWQGTPVDAYIRFLEQARPGFEYAGFNVADGQFPDSVDACDVYIITGSPRGVYDLDPWIARLLDFLREAFRAGKKLVGICFGHQALAQALGGRAEKSEKGFNFGLKQFDVSGIKPWMNGRRDSCSLYFVHQDQVTRLPPGAEHLGGNTFCPNIFFTIGEQVLGIQGHPEFTRAIMEQLIAGLPGVEVKVLAEAARSLDEGPPDNRLLAQWIVNFLKGRT